MLMEIIVETIVKIQYPVSIISVTIGAPNVTWWVHSMLVVMHCKPVLDQALPVVNLVHFPFWG